MDEILEVTEQQTEETTEEIVRHFATIGAVYEDGVSLIFDGEDAPTEKHYLCNTSTYFKELFSYKSLSIGYNVIQGW